MLMVSVVVVRSADVSAVNSASDATKIVLPFSHHSGVETLYL
jgi:hypothetical protein